MSGGELEPTAGEAAGAAAREAAAGLWGFASSAFQTVAAGVGEFAEALKEENKEVLGKEGGDDEGEDAKEEEEEEGGDVEEGGDAGHRPGEEAQPPSLLGGILSRVADATSTVMAAAAGAGEDGGDDGDGAGDGDKDRERARAGAEAAAKERDAAARRARLQGVQNTRDSFVTDPERRPMLEDLEEYATFEERFRDAYEKEWKAKVMRVLQTQGSVRSYFADLVPDEVPEWQFWSRYVYRVQQLDHEDERRRRLLAAGDSLHEALDASLSIAWEEDDDEDDNDEDEEDVALAGGGDTEGKPEQEQQQQQREERGEDEEDDAKWDNCDDATLDADPNVRVESAVDDHWADWE